MIKLATLFSGIGAIEQSLIRLHQDYEIVFACDNGEIEVDIDIEKAKKEISHLHNKKEKKKYVDNLYSISRKTNFVKRSYLANYQINEDDFHLDVRLLDGTDYAGEVDLLVGGSPCQSFSSIGFQGGLEDARGTLFYDYARIIQEVQPKVFIYENVRGLTTHDEGRTWAKIKDIFMNTLHYKITEPRVLNASDFGIPQTRRRLFVVGIRDDLNVMDFEYPKGIGTENLPFYLQDLLEDNCAFDPINFNYYYDKNGNITINSIPGHPDERFILTPKVRDYVLKSGTKNFRTSIETDKPIARTLLKTMTQHHRAGVDNYITVGFDSEGKRIIRSLTDRECMRLMGYPDSFKIVVSPMQAFKQAGNSIVVDVMMAIVRNVIGTGVFDI
ncbi:MAG: DNA (cytosine-5-)-methyltransferase [Christensenella sp.]|nr:DNA (cytosine-5-)-methyltransferase [Christensenella sp.]